MMRSNKIRSLLYTERPTIATRLDSTWPFYVESVGLTGNFDYVEFLAEYSPVTQDQMENIARAAELYDMGTMIKVDFLNRGFIAQKAVGSGFQGINFADHRNAEEVRETIRMMKPETPEDRGVFGYPNRRYIGCTPHIDQLAHAQRLRDVVLCFMIEKKAAVENIDAICSVAGVDMVQFGPSDYAMSSGWNRNEHKKEIVEVETHVIEVALRHGVQPRCEIDTLEQAEIYMKLGVRHFCLGDQSRILNAYWKGEGSRMRKAANQL
jgi:2-keto-3-deoxy-L-rhamnonate aldolase RhmA